jgi:hypothetical protein
VAISGWFLVVNRLRNSGLEDFLVAARERL